MKYTKSCLSKLIDNGIWVCIWQPLYGWWFEKKVEKIIAASQLTIVEVESAGLETLADCRNRAN
jgi:hypothetical protein